MAAGLRADPARAAVQADARIVPILAGDRRAISRAITVIENAAPAAAALAAALAPHCGRAHVVGITGAPGAGKSTLINALLGELLERGQRVAVVAVDPSSPVSGGAVLGDRVRMGEHGANEHVFIRSLSARGHLGGLSRTTARIVDVLDAAGFDTVIVETVGAGQSEVAIGTLADTSVVVCPPGLGDDIQAIKAGILEIANILVVNKGDLPAAERTERDLRTMLALRRGRAQAVPVLRTTATSGEGIAALADRIAEHAKQSGRGRRLRRVADANDVVDHLRQLAARDRYVRDLNVEFVGGGGGCATVRLQVQERHLNFNGSCHGGVIFALADTAFGLASNSHGTVAAGIDAHITYHVAVKEGDVLTASAVEVSRNAKLGVYRIDVKRADGVLTASFTGTVYVTPRSNAGVPAAAEG